MPKIISNTPLINISENRDLEKSVLDIFSEDESKTVFNHYGFLINPFVRPESWSDDCEYKKKFGSNLLVSDVFEKILLKDFLNAVTENKFFLIRGPSGIGKSTICELFYSLLSESEPFANNIKNILKIDSFSVLKLNFENENWKFSNEERIKRIKTQLEEFKASEKPDTTFLLIDNIAEISNCWTDITNLFDEYFGFFFIVGTIKVSEYLFLDYFREKSLNEQANTVNLFIEAFTHIRDIPPWNINKIEELIQKRINLTNNPKNFKFDSEVILKIAEISSGIPQLALSLLDKLFIKAYENNKINTFNIKTLNDLLTKDHVDKLAEFNMISRASYLNSDPPKEIRKLYNDLTKETRKSIIKNLMASYGGVKLRIGKYPSLSIDNRLKLLAKMAIKDNNLPLIASRLSEEVDKGASTITYHLDWLENQGLVTRKMQDEKEKIILLKESSIELFEVLSTTFMKNK